MNHNRHCPALASSSFTALAVVVLGLKNLDLGLLVVVDSCSSTVSPMLLKVVSSFLLVNRLLSLSRLPSSLIGLMMDSPTG